MDDNEVKESNYLNPIMENYKCTGQTSIFDFITFEEDHNEYEQMELPFV